MYAVRFLLITVVGFFLALEAAHAQQPVASLAQPPKSALSIHEAAAAGDLDRVKELLGQDTNVDAIREGLRETPLITALRSNQPKVAEFLIDKGANVNAASRTGDTALIHAAYWGLTDITRQLIAHGADITKMNTRGRLALHYAVERRHLDTATLLTPGPKLIDAHDTFGDTAFDFAVTQPSSEMAMMLLRAGARFSDDPNRALDRLSRCAQKGWLEAVEFALTETGDQPVMHQQLLDCAYYEALRSGDIKLLKRCAELGANTKVPGPSGLPQFVAAADLGQDDILEVFLNNGADIHQVEKYSHWTALHAAAYAGKFRTVALLLGKGADVNAVDSLGRTPLHLAAMAVRPMIVNTLLKSGADPARIDALGNSALHYAIKSKSVAIARSLIENDSPQVPDRDGKMPYDLAKDAGLNDLSALLQPSQPKQGPPLPKQFDETVALIAGGLAPEAAATVREACVSAIVHGEPMLHIAVQYGSLPAVKKIIEQTPASVSERDPDGFLPIHYAAENSSTEVLSELMTHNPALNDQENHARWTPLHFAASAGNVNAAEMLLKHGAKRDLRDGLGHTPADVADMGKHTDAAKSLR